MAASYTQHFANPHQGNTALAEALAIFSGEQHRQDCAKAQSIISAWPGYEPTPLISLEDMAGAARVKKILYKDESGRFGLGSFKALGGSYAVQQLAEQQRQGQGPLVVCTATDGNHGRSVAWGAQLLRVECHIFIHANVSQGRAASMADFGAQIHRLDGNYDASLAACADMAEDQGWQIVSDTSWPGYEEVPKLVMAGYSVMASEIIGQLDERPTHIFIQAGCGGLAGAMIACFWQRWREALPTIVIVESDKSDSVLQGIKANRIVLVDVVDETIMAGLSCGELSLVAWPLLQKGAKHILTIGDEEVVPMMRRLARPEAGSGRPPIEAGECSASGLIGLLAVAEEPALARQIGIDDQSIVLTFGTEGATDPDFYHSVISSS